MFPKQNEDELSYLDRELKISYQRLDNSMKNLKELEQSKLVLNNSFQQIQKRIDQWNQELNSFNKEFRSNLEEFKL